MAYVDNKHGPEKVVAFLFTAIVFGAFAYAFVTGLAYNVIKHTLSEMKVIDVNTPPPPPPKKPPPPPKNVPQPKTPPPPVAPPPIVAPPVVAPPIISTVTHAPPAPPPVITPKAPVAPPAPREAVGAKPRGNPGNWVTTEDYPPGAIRNNEQGRTGFKLSVSAEGRVTECTVTSSSGFSDLDATACRELQRRARFSPAKDASGNAIPTTYSSSVLWQIPKD